MKILCAEYNHKDEFTVIPLGDNVLLRNNDDFYIPEFSDGLSCVPQLVVRICRLGKSVGTRFANRYYEEIGVGLHLIADDFENRLRSGNLLPVLAFAYDICMAISCLMSRKEVGEVNYELRVNGNPVFASSEREMPVQIDRLVAEASGYYTLKIGDFIFCGSPCRYRGLQVNDRLQMSMNGVDLMNFRLK